MVDVFDYLTWRANVHGYVTLDGLAARSSPDVINDILKRAYLAAMLDENLAAGFSDWRQRQRSNQDEVESAYPAGVLSSLPPIRSLELTDPRLGRFLRTHSPLSRSAKIAIWQVQLGRCAICHKENPLRVFRERTDGALSAGKAEAPHYLAVCPACRTRHADVLDDLRRSRARKRSAVV
jgi:hypothetical protein